MPSQSCRYCQGTGIELIEMKHHSKVVGKDLRGNDILESYYTDEDRQNFLKIAPPEIVKMVTDCYGTLKTTQPFAIKCRSCNGVVDNRVSDTKKRSGIPYPSNLDDFKWDVYGKDMTNHVKLIESFVNDYWTWQEKNLGLYIYSSQKGTGKTMLASCIGNSMIEKHSMVTKFVPASEILNCAEVSNREGRTGGNDPIRQFKECKLLIIDDIGANKTAEGWLNDVLFGIIDYRVNHSKLTIFTSNLKPDELPLDPRIVDRVANKTYNITLPNVCIRTENANSVKMDFLKELGIR